MSAEASGAATEFAFTHKIFSLPGACIVMDEARREPAFHVMLGDLRVSLSFDVLQREFNIQERDSELLAIATRGLHYVHEIRPFDSIPRELLDGSASWSVEERHLRIACAKLVGQIGNSIGQGADTSLSVTRLLSFADDPLDREEVKSAMADMADTLGFGDSDEVRERVATYTREFAYIEALREATGQLQEMDLKLSRLTRVYRKDRTMLEELQRVRNLMRKPISEFADTFVQLDAQTGEIVALLRNVTRQVAYIRSVRDDLHHRLMKWRDLIDGWHDQPIESGRAAEVNTRALYQFLARDYAPKVDWR